MPPRTPKHVEEVVVERYLQHESVEIISPLVGVSEPACRAILKRYGVMRTQADAAKCRRARKSKVAAEDRQKIAALYMADRTVEEVAALFGISKSYCSVIIGGLCGTRSKSEAMALMSAMNQRGSDRYGKRGVFHSEKSNSWIATDSLYETARLTQHESNPTILEVGRCKNRIPYEFDGRHHHYVPDFELLLYCGRRVVEEVKPSNKVNTDINAAKFSAAKIYFKDKEIEFRVVTEKDIGRDALKAAESAYDALTDDERIHRNRVYKQRWRDELTTERREEEKRKARERFKLKWAGLSPEERAAKRILASDRRKARGQTEAQRIAAAERSRRWRDKKPKDELREYQRMHREAFKKRSCGS